MPIIAEFRVPATAFVLGDALDSVEGTVTVERMVADGEETVTPYVWVEDADFERFEAALGSDPSVGEFGVVETHERERLYRTAWRGGGNDFLDALAAVSATVLGAEGESGVWTLRALFSDRAAASAFEEDFRADHPDVDIGRLYEPGDPSTYGEYGVTEEQREALVVAHRAGYFSVPRACSLADVADELDISRNAASARLRRGQDALLDNTLDHEGNGPPT